jgi:plastocyanin
MIKKALPLFLLCFVLATTLIACGESSRNDGSTSESGNVVHMDNTKFKQPEITIRKGESITLVADTSILHVIANGAWENNTLKKGAEQGAPQVNDVQIGGNSRQNIGPFTTAGTFKLVCTIHPGMNLTVIVQ